MTTDNYSSQPITKGLNIMILRQLIIPGIFAAALHAGVLFAPNKKPPPPPPDVPATKDFFVGVLPKIDEPQTEVEKRDEVLEELKTIQPLPVLPDTLATAFDHNALRVPYDPTIPTPQIDGDVLMKIPPGDYRGGPRNMSGTTGIINLIDLDNRPRTVFQAAPEYPYILKGQGITGEVQVTFMVDERGNVEDVQVIRSTNTEFEAPTIRAVSKWRFEPGRKGGKKVKFRMSVPVAFTLSDSD